MSLAKVCCLLAIIACHYVISEAAGKGDPCSSSVDCTGTNLICVDKICTCSGNYVPSRTGNTCIPVVKHGENCTETIQCTYSNRTECIQNKCQCIQSYTYNGARCVGQAGLGNECQYDSDCVVPLDLTQRTIWCHGKTCSCRDGYTREDKRCVVGGDCDTDIECRQLANSYCDQRAKDRYKCQCNNDYIVAGNRTACEKPVTEIGTGCNFDEQCSEKLGKAECRGNQCKCVSGASVNNKNVCTMPICETKEDCNLWETPTISDCVDGLCHCTGGSDYSEKKKGCECPEGLVIGKSKCIEVQNTPGGLCEENIQCNNGTLGNLAVCDRKQCHCSKGSVLVNEVCRQKKNPSQDCEYDGECSHIDNFACLDKVCACKEGYVINEDDNTCFKKLQSMWSPCIHDLQCIKSFGEGTVCRTKCICKSDYQPVDNVKCVKTKTVPGVECSSSSECNEEDTICVEGKCLKKDGHSKLSSSTSAIILMLLIYFILTANRRVT